MVAKIFNQDLARDGKLPEMDIAETSRKAERKGAGDQTLVKKCPFCSSVAISLIMDWDSKCCYLRCDECKSCGPPAPLFITGSGSFVKDQSVPMMAACEGWNKRGKVK